MAEVAGNRHGRFASSWWGSTTPPNGPFATANTWVGVEMQFTVDGIVAGFRAFRPGGMAGPYAIFWSNEGPELLVAYTFKDVAITPDTWQNLWFRPYLRIDTAKTYRLAVMYPGGQYSRQTGILTVPGVVHNQIRFTLGFQTTSLYPPTATISTNTNANGVDALFYPDA